MRKRITEAETDADRTALQRNSAARKLVRETVVRLFGHDLGCFDSGCAFGHPGGMHTNGGCHCLYNGYELRDRAMKLARVAHELAKMKGMET